MIAVPDEDLLNEKLECLWRLEDVGLKAEKCVSEDNIAIQKFNQTIRFDPERGKYEVGWPWKLDEPVLPNNFGLSLGRLRSLLERTDLQTLQRYNQTIQDQLKAGIIEEAPRDPEGKLVYHIPHHCIIKPDKATTKLRIVFDASSKPKQSTSSLNESLHRGPVLLADLCGLLIRFRLREIGIISDLEKAFLQVGLRKQDRDVIRFIWVKNIEKPAIGTNLIVYRFCRVLLGVVSSPYVLAGTIEHHLQAIDSPSALEILKHIYVDNVIVGRNNLEEARKFYNEAKTLFESAVINLREWYSNNKEFTSGLPESDHKPSSTTTVVGLKWDLETDRLSCKANFDCTALSTKRKILEFVASVFDPCGFFSPIYVRGKLILLDLWQIKAEWDAVIPV